MSNQIEPSWANYIAMDGDGLESFHEKRPILVNNRWRSKGKQMLVDNISNDSSRFKESLRFTDQTERKLSAFMTSIYGKENEERFERLFNWIKSEVANRKIDLKNLTHIEIGDLTAEYVIEKHYQSIAI